MLWLLFITGLFLTLTLPMLFPALYINYFTPFLTLSIYRLPIKKTLWFAALIGVLIDLLSAQQRFGLTALNFTLSLYLLSFFRKTLFEDSYSTLPIMAFLFSLFSSLLFYPLFLLFDKPLPASPEFLGLTLLIMPLFDSAFTFILYTVPRLLFGSPQKKGQDYFLRR